MAADLSGLSRLAALAEALERVATATAAASPAALSACESPLATALADMPSPSELSNVRAGDVTLHLRRIQLALQRCRRVGYALAELVTVSLAAQGVAPGYAPAGAPGQLPRLGRLEVRA